MPDLASSIVIWQIIEEIGLLQKIESDNLDPNFAVFVVF